MKRLSFVLLTILIISIAFGGSGCGSSYTVYGRVVDELDQGIANVTITFSGGYSGTTITDADGNWSKADLKGIVLVTPSRAGWTFEPTNKQLTKATTGVDFIGELSEVPELTAERAQELLDKGDIIQELFYVSNPEEAADEAINILEEDADVYACGKFESGKQVWWVTNEGVMFSAGEFEEEYDGDKISSPSSTNSSFGKNASAVKGKPNEASFVISRMPKPDYYIENVFVGNSKAIAIAPYLDEMESEREDSCFCPFVTEMLEDYGGTTQFEVTVYENEECDLDVFKGLDNDYGIVYIHTHGNHVPVVSPEWEDTYPDYSEIVVFGTKAPVTADIMEAYNKDITTGLLGINKATETYSIFPGFISKYCSGMNDTLVYMGSCSSAYNDSMAKAFLGAGAKTYFGHNDTVYRYINKECAVSLFEALLEGETSGSAFEDIDTEHPIFDMYGEEDLLLVADPADEITLTLPGGVPLTMTLIPAGTFMMGSLSSDSDRSIIEEPQHQVTITKSFYMGIYEVTQEQWKAVMGNNPSWFNYNPKNPVECVSWNDCQDFIMELNTLGIGTFRLPTEAEWEYACRAGSTTRFPWGDDPGYNTLGQYAWYRDNSGDKTHPVGQKEPNAWGLSDMHGNVYEWCSDWFGDYSSASQTDPTGPSSGDFRILRGGDWYLDPQFCRSANRSGSTPTGAYNFLGFRLVREL